MRRVSWIAVLWLAASACDDSNERTSGPIESIAHVSSDRVVLHAVRHRLELASLPIGERIGLPVSGTVELDAQVTIPLHGFEPDYPAAHGTVALRCVAHCQIGDDVARLQAPSAGAFAPDGIQFGHLALDGLDVRVAIADGHARVTRFALASPDLELDLKLDVALDRDPADSLVDGCISARPTPALQARDAKLYTMLTLMAPSVGPDGRTEIALGGPASRLRAMARHCASGDGSN